MKPKAVAARTFTLEDCDYMLTDKKIAILNSRRPPCPECNTRMICAKPGGRTFECMKCGHVESISAPKKSAPK